MKISVDSHVLAEVVGWAARALPQRPSVPVLAGIHLAAADGTLTLSVFDYDVSARASIEADVADPGTVLLPGRVLAEVTKALPAGMVDLVLSGSEVTITCGRSEFGLLTLPVSDYPTLPVAPDPVGTVDAATLLTAVEQVAAAAAKDGSLPMLTGVRVDTVGDLLTMACTDRYRIHARTLPWAHTGEAEQAALLPAATFRDIAKAQLSGPVQLGLSDALAVVTGGGRTSTVRLLEPQFIPYEDRLVDDYPSHAVVDVAPLIAAVKRVALVADRGTAVRLAFTSLDGGDGEVLVQAGGGDAGRGRDVLPAVLDGPDVETAFQPGYLLDALTAVAQDATAVRLATTGPAKPVLITPATDEPAFRALVMALRLA
jgi:DNA polymerase-3 subunit beta